MALSSLFPLDYPCKRHGLKPIAFSENRTEIKLFSYCFREDFVKSKLVGQKNKRPHSVKVGEFPRVLRPD